MGGGGMTFTVMTSPLPRISYLVSAGLFITYIVIRFGLKYPDKSHPALDTFALIMGALSCLIAALLFIPL